MGFALTIRADKNPRPVSGRGGRAGKNIFEKLQGRPRRDKVPELIIVVQVVADVHRKLEPGSDRNHLVHLAASCAASSIWA